MSHSLALISPATLHALGWALMHFLWEGAALAALYAAASAFCRTASARYILGVAVLAAMLVAPAITFTQLLPRAATADSFFAADFSSNVAPVANQAASASSARNLPSLPATIPQSGALLLFVELWFAGVVLLSLRAAGGFFAIERMRRRESKPVSALLLERCRSLQRRLRLDRVVQFCECRHLDAPAVIGWFRPVVLLPLSALTGLSDEQLEAVIAHELAHIRRFDSFVNLFQTAAETLLFYHPAVWWVSKRTRDERENCCDDVAISVCGDAVGYARALTLMEEWRSAPSFAMAANRGSLAARVRRLLGLDSLSSSARSAGFAASFFCLAGALLAGNAFVGVAQNFFGFDGVPYSMRMNTAPPAAAPLAKALNRATSRVLNNVASRVLAQVTESTQSTTDPAPQAASSSQSASSSSGSYIEQMKAAGFDNLTVEQLISLKVQGVTPEYVKQIQDLGLKPSVDELISMKVQGISPDYIRDMRAAGVNADMNHLIGMKVQGLTPEYVKQVKALGLEVDEDKLIGMKVQGITPEYVQAMRAAGADADIDRLIGMKVQGVTPEYVKAMKATGLPDFKNDPDNYIAAKVNGITPEFVKQVQSRGFKDLDLDKIIALKNAGIF